MSNDVHLEADFTLNIPHLEADFTENQQPDIQADFIIESGRTQASFEDITGNPYDNSALAEALNQKADTSTVEELSETVTNNYNTLDFKIDTHIADKTNPHEVTKTQIGLGNVDNTSDLNKPISTATQTALNSKQNTISDLSEIRSNASNGQSAYNTIQNYGDIVTYDASSFATNLQGQKADTALQPNDDISELNNDAGYITSASLPTVNNSTITFQKNNVTVGDINLNQPNNETINFEIPTKASDVNALPDTITINDLTTPAQQNAINSGATSDNIGQIATNTSNLNSLQTTVTNNYNTLDGRITSEVSALNTAIGTEATNRQNADNNLQSQIDTLVQSSEVFDIVGTYTDLQNYDISTVPVNDIIKVLVDSTHSNAATYYRCVESGGVKSWLYLGSEGAYYTKSESDSLFVDKSTTINGQDLSNNITLTATDVGALPSSTTIGSGTLTIQNNGVDVDTFNANATSNKTINLVTPTKTSDLVNDSGFIDSSGLSNYATQTDLTNGLATKQDTINDLSTIRQNAQNGQSAYTTIQGYGDIVTYNASNFATSAQGSLADTALQQGDNISLLNNNAGYITGIGSSDVITALGYTPYNSTNPAGYTSNIGTVTSVNGNQPDSSGNVTISVTGGANTDLSNLTATGETHFQAPLVSGTNIKTVNNTSILGSGNIDTSEIFIAEYGVTSFADIETAYNAGKVVFCKTIYELYVLVDYHSNVIRFSSIYGNETTSITLLKNPASGTGWTSTNSTLQYSNLVTSLSSSSTDTQYPSAKCVYDQLALKQNASTAVTHTANTAVGNSTTPVYINSSGVATSTGLSIASSRFDGQWVMNVYGLYNYTTAGTRTHDLNSIGYLPNDGRYYEILCHANTGYSSATVRQTITANNVDQYYVYVNSSINSFHGYFTMIVGTDHTLQVNVSAKCQEAALSFLAYRRIGTNS